MMEFQKESGVKDEFVVLNDSETFTSLEGCCIVDNHGTVWDLKKLFDTVMSFDTGDLKWKEECIIGGINPETKQIDSEG